MCQHVVKITIQDDHCDALFTILIIVSPVGVRLESFVVKSKASKKNTCKNA